MKSSKKSRAEIQRAYRQRLLEKNADEARERERKRWHQRCSLNKVHKINNMTEREKRMTRKRWRTKKAQYRAQLKAIRARTPPPSDEDDISTTSTEQAKRGRKKVAYSRTKANRRVLSLTAELASARMSKEKYKKRWLRLRMSKTSGRNGHQSTATPDNSTSSSIVGCDTTDTTPSNTDFNMHDPASTPHNTGIENRRRNGNTLDDVTKSLIEAFFTRDDNSRITTGKKQTVTKNKVKEQKRLLLDSLTNLHEKFSSEHPDNNISYVTFTRYRPFFVRQPTAKDRDTCLCKKHENIQLAVDKLYHLGTLKTKHAEQLLGQVCCSTEKRECMFRECEVCANKRLKFEDNCLLKDDSIVIWHEWNTISEPYEKNGEEKLAKVTKKCVKRGSLKELKANVCECVREQLAKHVYNVRHQFRAYKTLKESIETNEAVIHVDFSENYICKNAAEIQSAHFGGSNKQATLHTGVVYLFGEHHSFTTISESLRHDPSAIWAHLKPVLHQLKRTHPEVTYIHFFSDGPTTQYRNKANFYFFSTVLHQMGFHAATWNFFESGHGKGAPDGIGGSVKRQADSWVSSGVDVPSAQKLFDFLECGNSTIQFYFIDPVEITEFDALWPSTLKPINGTMKVHQLHTDDKFSVSYRNLSCFCQRPTLCSCYNVRRHRFAPKEPHIVSSLHLLLSFQIILFIFALM